MVTSGVQSEASSLAGHLGLGRLIVLYDNNHVTLSASTPICFTEDVPGRYRAYGWHVLEVGDGNDLTAITAAIESAREVRDRPSLISVQPQAKLRLAVELFHRHGISQLPVIEGEHIVGSLNEASIMKALHDGVDLNNQQIGVVMGKPLPVLDEQTGLPEAYRLLFGGSPALIVTRHAVPLGLISRLDLINTLIHRDANAL